MFFPSVHFQLSTWLSTSLLAYFCSLPLLISLQLSISVPLSAGVGRAWMKILKWLAQPRAQFRHSTLKQVYLTIHNFAFPRTSLLDVLIVAAEGVKLYFVSISIYIGISNLHIGMPQAAKVYILRNISGAPPRVPPLPSSLSFCNNSGNFGRPAELHCLSTSFRTTCLNGTNFPPVTKLQQNSSSNVSSQRSSR